MIRCRRRINAPALIWTATSAPVRDTPGMPKRPTKRIEVIPRDQLELVPASGEQVWFVRSRREWGPKVVVHAGRAMDNDLVLNDYSVSQHHLAFEVRSWKSGGGCWALRVDDLESLNGTRVNGESVVPGELTAVPMGSRLEVGRLCIELIDPPALMQRIIAAARDLERPAP